MNPLILARDLIQNAGIANAADDLFVDTLPEGRSKFVSLRGYGSSAPELSTRGVVESTTTPTHYLHEKPRFQVVVCDEKYEAAYDRIDACYQLFLQSGRSQDGCTTIAQFRPLQVPFSTGRDKNNRHLFGFNVELYAIRNLGD
jgi:hypothetical protein